MTVKQIDYDIYSLLAEKLKNSKGYVVYYMEIDAEAVAKTFHFEDKEHFERNFEYVSAFPYPGMRLKPRFITETFGICSYECDIDGEIYYIEDKGLYLVIDGVEQR